MTVSLLAGSVDGCAYCVGVSPPTASLGRSSLHLRRQARLAALADDARALVQ